MNEQAKAELDDLKRWVREQDAAAFRVALDEETGQVIRRQPPLPPATSDEVLAQNYRTAQAQATLNLYHRANKAE